LLKLRNPFFELEPNSVLRTDDPDRTGIAPDARKAFQQPFKQNSTWDHPNWCAQPVHDSAATCLHIRPPFEDVTSWPSRNN
jgi:hypothetical protein